MLDLPVIEGIPWNTENDETEIGDNITVEYTDIISERWAAVTSKTGGPSKGEVQNGLNSRNDLIWCVLWSKRPFKNILNWNRVFEAKRSIFPDLSGVFFLRWFSFQDHWQHNYVAKPSAIFWINFLIAFWNILLSANNRIILNTYR